MAGKASSHWPITLTNGAAALFNLFLPLAIVRILSPAEVGRYKIFFLYVMLSPALFFISGLDNGLYHWVGKYPRTKPEVRQSWTLLVAISILLSLIGLVFSKPFAPLMNVPALDMRLFLLSAPFVLASLFLEDLMIARGDIWTGSLYASGFNVLRAMSIVAAAWWTHDMGVALWVFFVGTVLRALLGWLLLVKSGELQFIFSKAASIPVLRYAVPVSIASIGLMALQNVDQMILSFRLSSISFAFYSIGCLTLPPLLILESSVNRVLIPRMSEAFAADKPSEAAALFSDGVSELFRFLLPATVGLMLYSQPIIRILFTDRYTAAAIYLRVYALSYLILSLPYDAVARSRGDGGWIMRTSVFFALVCVPAVWLATGRWSAMGALIAIMASQLVMRLYSLLYDRKCFSAPYSEFLPLNDMLIQMGLTLVAAAFSLVMRPLFSDQRTWFYVTGPLFTLIYFGAIYLVYLKKNFSAQGPIHVLELVQTLSLGGLEKMVYTLAQSLNQQKSFRVRVATYEDPEGQLSLVPQFAEAGIPLTQWQKGEGFSFRSVLRLVQIIFFEKTRILHVHDLGPLIYGSLAKFFSLGRVRLMLTLHTLLDIEKNKRYRFYYKVFLHFPDRIIAVSPAVKLGLLNLGVRADRIDVIPNGVSFSVSSTRTKNLDEKQALRKRLMPALSADLYETTWILCLARLHPGKGHAIVLDVWRALPPEARAQLTLFFVGQETQPGFKASLLRKIHDTPDRHRLIVAGPTDRPQDWIQSADLFISGSILEGMPLAPLEAAGSGLPTVLTDIEGHRFLAPWAHSFDPQKPEDGARKILDILDTLKKDGEIRFFEKRWEAASSIREQWGTSPMTASYMAIFQSN